MSTFFIDSTAVRRAKLRMRGLCVTARYCAGHAFLYPFMGIVSPYNVQNVRVTARVIYSTCTRQKISYPYMGTA